MNNKLKKYIDYNAMYDLAVMYPYITTFKKLKEYIGASEDTVLMVEEGIINLPINDFNYQGRITTFHDPAQIEKVGRSLFSFLSDDIQWESLLKRLSGYEQKLELVMNTEATERLIKDAKENNLYNDIYTKYYDLYLEVATIYLITDGRYHEYSIHELKEHGITTEAISRMTLPEKKSSFQLANDELNEISKLFKGNNRTWEERFNIFIDKYIWFYLADTHYDFDQVVSSLREKLNTEQTEEKEIVTATLEVENISENDKKVLSRISELGFQRMELRKYWQWIDYMLHVLLYNFAKEKGLPEKTLVFLTDDEIRNILSGNISSLEEMLQIAEDRSQLFASSLENDRVSVYSNEKEIFELRERLVSIDAKDSLLKGNISYKAEGVDKITGIARVITWSKDILKELNEIKEGEILVVTQTKPDFLPFLKKAKAIVSDEGGITSHVSIVTRELQIPAIVGTRIATDSIKTGSIIEMDMLTGLVKIIS